jgi:hypothetical protein
LHESSSELGNVLVQRILAAKGVLSFVRDEKTCSRSTRALPIVLMIKTLNAFLWLWLRQAMLASGALWLATANVSVLAAEAVPGQASPLQIVLVEAGQVTPATVSKWKQEGFNGVALILDDRTGGSATSQMARTISEGGLERYYWIEVGRNPKLAGAHPRWMAALGTHADWRKDFPNLPDPKAGEVAKAFPWVPIGYREAFDAHLARVQELLKGAPAGWHGLLLNDLQAGPSSCGCGNLQCRWAIDYHVHPTATKLSGDDVAARFVAEVRKRAPNKDIVPVWTTECEDVDLPAEKHEGRAGTGMCGTVGCATATCPDIFTRQWSALASGQEGPVALLALHTPLRRTQKEFGGGPGWVTNTMAYLEETVPKHGGKAIAPNRLWVVVEGLQPTDEATARERATKAGVGAVIVARSKIEQGYEPKMIPVE